MSSAESLRESFDRIVDLLEKAELEKIGDELESLCDQTGVANSICTTSEILDAIVRILNEGSDTAVEKSTKFLWWVCSVEFASAESLEKALSLADCDKARTGDVVCSLLGHIWVKRPSARMATISIPVAPKTADEKFAKSGTAQWLARASTFKSMVLSPKRGEDLHIEDCCVSVQQCVASRLGLLEALVNTLQNGSQISQENSVGTIWNLACSESLRGTLVATEGLVVGLTHAIRQGHDRLQELSLGALWALSLSEDLKGTMLKVGMGAITKMRAGGLKAMAEAVMYRLGMPVDAQAPAASLPAGRKGKEIYLPIPPPRSIAPWENEQYLQLWDASTGAVVFTVESGENIRIVISGKGCIGAGSRDRNVSVYHLVLFDSSKKPHADSSIRKLNGGDSRDPSSLLARRGYNAEEVTVSDIRGQYWFSVDGASGIVMAGKGNVGQGIFLLGIDRSPIEDAKYVAASNFDSAVELREIRVTWAVPAAISSEISIGAYCWSPTLEPKFAGTDAIRRSWGNDNESVWGTFDGRERTGTEYPGFHLAARGAKCEMNFGAVAGHPGKVLTAKAADSDRTRPMRDWIDEARGSQCSMKIVFKDVKAAVAVSQILGETMLHEYPLMGIDGGRSALPGVILQAEVAKGPTGKSAPVDIGSFLEGARIYIPYAIFALAWTFESGTTAPLTDKMFDDILKKLGDYKQLAISFVLPAEIIESSFGVVQRIFATTPLHWTVTVSATKPLPPAVEHFIYSNMPFDRTFFDIQMPAAELLAEVAVRAHEGKSARANCDALFLKCLNADPRRGASMVNYARFLAVEHLDFNAVEKFCVRAMECDPSCGSQLTDVLPEIISHSRNPDTFHHYSLFLKTVKNDLEQAEEYCLRALEANNRHAGALQFFVANYFSKCEGDLPPLSSTDRPFIMLTHLVQALPGVDDIIKPPLLSYLATFYSLPKASFAFDREVVFNALGILLARLKSQPKIVRKYSSIPSAPLPPSTALSRPAEIPPSSPGDSAEKLDPLATLSRAALSYLAVFGAGVVKAQRESASFDPLLSPKSPLSLHQFSPKSSPKRTERSASLSLPRGHTAWQTPIRSLDPKRGEGECRLRWLMNRVARVSVDMNIVKREFDDLNKTLKDLAPRELALLSRLDQNKDGFTDDAHNLISGRKIPSRIDCRAAEDLVSTLRDNPSAVAVILKHSGYLGSVGAGEGRGSRRYREAMARSVILSVYGAHYDYSINQKLATALRSIVLTEYSLDPSHTIFENETATTCSMSVCLVNCLIRTSSDFFDFAQITLEGACQVALDSMREAPCLCPLSAAATTQKMAESIVENFFRRVDELPPQFKWLISLVCDLSPSDPSLLRKMIFDAIFLWVGHYLTNPDVLRFCSALPVSSRHRLSALASALRKILFKKFINSTIFEVLEEIGGREDGRVTVGFLDVENSPDEDRGQARRRGGDCGTPLAFLIGPLWELVSIAAEFLDWYFPERKKKEIGDGEKEEESVARLISDDCFQCLISTSSPLPFMFDRHRDEVVLVQVGNPIPSQPDFHADVPRHLSAICKNIQVLMLDSDFDNIPLEEGLIAAIQIFITKKEHQFSDQSSLSLAFDTLSKLKDFETGGSSGGVDDIFSLIDFDISAKEKIRNRMSKVLPILVRRASVAEAAVRKFTQIIHRCDLGSVSPLISEFVSDVKYKLKVTFPRGRACVCRFDVVDTKYVMCDSCESVYQIVRNKINVWTHVDRCPRSRLLQILFSEAGSMIYSLSSQDEDARAHLQTVAQNLCTDNPEIKDKYVVPHLWSLAMRRLELLMKTWRHLPIDLLSHVQQFVSTLRNAMASDPDPDALHDITIFCLCHSPVSSLVFPTIRYILFSHLLENDLENTGETVHQFLEENGLFNLVLDLHYALSLSPSPHTRSAKCDEIIYAIQHVDISLVSTFLRCCATLRANLPPSDLPPDFHRICHAANGDPKVALAFIQIQGADTDSEIGNIPLAKILAMSRWCSDRIGVDGDMSRRGFDGVLEIILTEIDRRLKTDLQIAPTCVRMGLLEIILKVLPTMYCRREVSVGASVRSLLETISNFDNRSLLLNSKIESLLRLLPLSDSPDTPPLPPETNFTDLAVISSTLSENLISNLKWGRESCEKRVGKDNTHVTHRLRALTSFHRILSSDSPKIIDLGDGATVTLQIVHSEFHPKIFAVTPDTKFKIVDADSGYPSLKTENIGGRGEGYLRRLGGRVRVAVAPPGVTCIGENLRVMAEVAMSAGLMGELGLFDGDLVAIRLDSGPAIPCLALASDIKDKDLVCVHATLAPLLVIGAASDGSVGGEVCEIIDHPPFVPSLFLKIFPPNPAVDLGAVQSAVECVIKNPLRSRRDPATPFVFPLKLITNMATRLADHVSSCPVFLPLKIQALPALLGGSGLMNYWEYLCRTGADGCDDAVLEHTAMAEHLLYNRPASIQEKLKFVGDELRYATIGFGPMSFKRSRWPELCVQLKDEVKLRSLFLPMRQSEILRRRGTVFPAAVSKGDPPDPLPNWMGIRGEDIVSVWPHSQSLLRWVSKNVFRSLLFHAYGSETAVGNRQGTRVTSWGEAGIAGPITCADVRRVIISNQPKNIESWVQKHCADHGIELVVIPPATASAHSAAHDPISHQIK